MPKTKNTAIPPCPVLHYTMNVEEFITQLRSLADPINRDGQRRFGITPSTEHLGIGMTTLRKRARGVKKNTPLAEALWQSGIHEARILATIVADKKSFSRSLADGWANDFDSWDITDQACKNIFKNLPYAPDLIEEYTQSDATFVKRAGFVLMAEKAVHDKKAEDADFLPLLTLVLQRGVDERNFVRKASNWALRQIGKRNPFLREHAMQTAEQILALNTPAARWIARDALRELQKQP